MSLLLGQSNVILNIISRTSCTFVLNWNLYEVNIFGKNLIFFLTTFVFPSSLGTISIRKSNVSHFDIASATSFFCKVLLLFSSVCIQALKVSSWIKSSAAFENKTGASALIIFTSSSNFMIFFILAKGNSGDLKKTFCCWKKIFRLRFYK